MTICGDFIVASDKSLCVPIILLSKIKVIAIGIIGARANPRILQRMFMLRSSVLPPVNTVPASDRMIITVRIMPTRNGLLLSIFNEVLVHNNPIK